MYYYVTDNDVITQNAMSCIDLIVFDSNLKSHVHEIIFTRKFSLDITGI